MSACVCACVWVCACACVHARPTQLDQVVDGEQDLHLGGQRLDGRGPVVLVDSGQRLGAQVAGLQQGAHQHLAHVATQLGQGAVAWGAGEGEEEGGRGLADHSLKETATLVLH